jgi:hypothetical protein
MRKLYIFIITFTCLYPSFAQDIVSPSLFEEMAMGKEPKNTSVNLFLSVGYDNMQNRNFSDRIVSLGHTALPTEFMTTGFGFSLVREKWTILNLDISLGRSTDFGDLPDFNNSLFFSHLKAGIGYNLFDVQHQFRLEPGIGLVYGNGRYQMQPSQIDASFDQVVGAREYNELNLRQNNYGLNFNLTLSQNQFFDPSRMLTNFFGLEVGTNLMLFRNELTPNLTDSPDFNLSTFYVKVKINVLSP